MKAVLSNSADLDFIQILGCRGCKGMRLPSVLEYTQVQPTCWVLSNNENQIDKFRSPKMSFRIWQAYNFLEQPLNYLEGESILHVFSG